MSGNAEDRLRRFVLETENVYEMRQGKPVLLSGFSDVEQFDKHVSALVRMKAERLGFESCMVEDALGELGPMRVMAILDKQERPM